MNSITVIINYYKLYFIMFDKKHKGRGIILPRKEMEEDNEEISFSEHIVHPLPQEIFRIEKPYIMI